MTVANHQHWTKVRTRAYDKLFGGPPRTVFTPSMLFRAPGERIVIDIFVYGIESSAGAIEVAVTNGMSDERMEASEATRRELIQYFPRCTEHHARRLHDMAWLPRFDQFVLDSHHSIAWDQPALEGTPWRHAFFLEPLIRSHREFACEIDGDPMSLLWHIPISDSERELKREQGSDALIDRMEQVNLPWVFDEANRPPLVE